MRAGELAWIVPSPGHMRGRGRQGSRPHVHPLRLPPLLRQKSKMSLVLFKARQPHGDSPFLLPPLLCVSATLGRPGWTPAESRGRHASSPIGLSPVAVQSGSLTCGLPPATSDVLTKQRPLPQGILDHSDDIKKQQVARLKQRPANCSSIYSFRPVVAKLDSGRQQHLPLPSCPWRRGFRKEHPLEIIRRTSVTNTGK